MLTCLVNPKAHLFMVAVFLRPERGGIRLQTAPLGAIIAVTRFCVYDGYCSRRRPRSLAGRPRVEAALDRRRHGHACRGLA
jgi:threonine/homoserine/homoserine lactone efflux protein